MTAELMNFVAHDTKTHVPAPAPLRRIAIIGTAPSWKACPYQDPTLEIWTLNDGYLVGVPRTDRHFDLHPFHQMHFRAATNQGGVDPATVPLGSYLRPHGHLDWLRTRPVPVYVAEAREDFPTSQTYPREAVLEFFRDYWPLRIARNFTIRPGDDYEVSTPSWMLMLAIMEGVQEIHIYGIHLATQWEYLQQRPNFEFLMGIAAGMKRKLVLPESAPICKAGYRYAFEPKADLPVQQAEADIARIKNDGLKWKQQLAALPLYAFGQRKALTAKIQHSDVLLADARQVHARALLKAQHG